MMGLLQRGVLVLSAMLVVLATAQAGPPTPDPAGASIAEEIAFLMNGLIVDTTLRPGVNVVDTYAAAFNWTKNPPEMNALLNAKVGYHAKINGHTVVLGGDGTNDIFAVAIKEGFDPAKALAALKQAFTLKDVGPDDSAGQRSEGYTVLDHGRNVGLLFLTYGTAEAIRGTGTVSFMSAKKVQAARGQ